MSAKFAWTEQRERDIRTLEAGAFASKYGVSKNFTSRARRVRDLATWRRDDVRLVCPHAAVPLLGTMPDDAVAERFGVNRSTVVIWRAEKGIPSHQDCSRDRLDDELRAAHALETSMRTVAELTGWNIHRVRARAKALGLQFRRGRPKRDAPTARITAMATLRACGWHLDEIGQVFGVGKNAVYMVLDKWGLA